MLKNKRPERLLAKLDLIFSLDRSSLKKRIFLAKELSH
jgi:hypothetical protein